MSDLVPIAPMPLTEMEVGPIRAQTDNIGEAYGLAGVVILVAVALRIIAKYL